MKGMSPKYFKFYNSIRHFYPPTQSQQSPLDYIYRKNLFIAPEGVYLLRNQQETP